jgi:2,4-dienoyl-CoA reductase-like NADH-dependent reductase (Old Yellow Enzyme family)
MSTKQLFEPVTLGGISCKNRLVRSATFEAGGAVRGAITPLLKTVYEELADGGIGTIITGTMCVSPTGAFSKGMVQVQDPSFPAAFSDIVKMLHEKDCRIVAQINHSGSRTNPKMLPEGMLPLAPSDSDKTQAMTIEQIHQTVQDFAVCAKICKDAGADGVQLHAAHGYLASEFLSPFFNRRTDEYGGPIENRARFLFEMYEAARAAVGPEYPLWIKINREDLTDPGMTEAEFQWVCEELDRRGINAIEVSCGLSETRDSKSFRPVPNEEAEAYNAQAAVDLATKVKATVISVGGYRTPAIIDKWLNAGGIEGISISRPLILDPALPNRWKSGDLAKPKCISCNKCFASAPIGCGAFPKDA